MSSSVNQLIIAFAQRMQANFSYFTEACAAKALAVCRVFVVVKKNKKKKVVRGGGRIK